MTDSQPVIRMPSDKDVNYLKARKQLIKIFYPFVAYPNEQIPFVIDALSLMFAALDGNAFYNFVNDDGLTQHQQYDDISVEVLRLGIEAFMKNHSMKKTNNAEFEYLFAYSLTDACKDLVVRQKQISSYAKKRNKVQKKKSEPQRT